MEDAYIDKQNRKDEQATQIRLVFNFSLRLLNKKTYLGLLKKYTLKYY